MLRPVTRALPLLLLLSACAIGGDSDDPTIASTLGGTASISLKSSSAKVTQTSDTSWDLDKAGTVNTTNKSVTWTITATKGATVGGQLVVNGTFTVQNTGTGGATIGNIVVNLQTKSGSQWITRSSDIANATDGDAATTANIFKQASSENKSTFTENTASGELEFMDATTNTLFSLVPQVTIPAGGTRTLLFSASYDNTVLNLATGTAIRAEIIVSFGNATANGASAPNIDINGNGIIDSDEARVRSVPSRLTLAVPAQTNGNGAVTLSDTLADISTTGTVTFSNATFNLGATSGTVSVNYTAGTTGGSITNCAHLTSPGTTVSIGGFNFPVAGINLLACDTRTIGAPPTCTPGTPGCAWQTGNVVTYTQGAWSSSGIAYGVLTASFGQVYFATGGVLEVGIAGAGGFSMQFSDASTVGQYLPAVGALGPLNSDLFDPTTSSSGVFGGEVVALALNVDFADDDVTGGTSATAFGDLSICGAAPLANMTVRAFLGVANTALGGGSTGYSILDLTTIAAQLNASFSAGTPSTFAQQRLVIGTCP